MESNKKSMEWGIKNPMDLYISRAKPQSQLEITPTIYAIQNNRKNIG